MHSWLLKLLSLGFTVFHMRPVASHATGGSHEAIGAVVREDRVEEPKDAHEHRTWDD